MLFRHRPQITIYTGGSALCELTKDYFRQAGLDFEEADVLHDKNALKALQDLTKKSDTPVVNFDGRIITGFQPDLFGILIQKSETGQVIEPSTP
jgi:glutaredoxin